MSLVAGMVHPKGVPLDVEAPDHLAFSGVPIAEELTMGWGGWKMTDSGRQTFRENYLGPEPDWIAGQTMELLELPGSG